MKKIIIVLSAVLALASCQKEDLSFNEKNAGTDKSQVLYADIDLAVTKTSLSGVKTNWIANDEFKAFDTDGNSVNYKFVSGDQFEQVSTTKSGNFDISKFAAAYYPASNFSSYNSSTQTFTVTVPATQTYAEGTFATDVAPMASNVIETDGGKKIVKFKNAFAVVKIPVSYTANHANFAPKVDYISLTSATTKLNGTFNITLSGTNTVTVGAGNGTNTITLENCNDAGVMGATAKDFYIVVPGLQDNEKITVYVNNGVTKRASTTANRTSDSANPLKQNNILNMPEVTIFDDGTVNGQFSVSATQQVYLSQGNLQYRANPADWRFAPNQWTVIGSGNANPSSTSSNYIDLFGYGTSGASYQPYMTSTDRSSYPASNISGTQNDWGVHNAISNGGNTANLWRTLTQAEWNYLFRRANGFAYATVNGRMGVILFPDGYDASGIVNYWPNFNGDENSPQWIGNPTSQTFAGDSWAKLESSGCVFIPVCGLRTGTTVPQDGSTFNGNYWTSTYDRCSWGGDRGNVRRYIYFYKDSSSDFIFRTGESNNGGDAYGFAVRLARNAN